MELEKGENVLFLYSTEEILEPLLCYFHLSKEVKSVLLPESVFIQVSEPLLE